MNNRLTWSDYVRSLSDNQGEIAVASQTSQSTVSRWLSGAVIPDARQVITVARAYNLSPVAALVAAGYLTPQELGDSHAMPRVWNIRQFTDLELALETVRRIESGSHPVLEDPITGNHPAIANVRTLHPNDSGFLDDSVKELDKAAGTDETQAEDD